MISHIVLINSKSELSSHVESLLKLSLYKIQNVKKLFKTILYFIIRDKTSDSDIIINSQFDILKSCLVASSSEIDDVNSNVFSLPNSYFEDADKCTSKRIKKVNKNFPQEVLLLKKEILEIINNQTEFYRTFIEFYSKFQEYLLIQIK